MSTFVARKKKLVLSREVMAFANERGLTPYLPAVVRVFQRVFMDAKKLSVEVDYDPDVAGLRHLLFRAVVAWPESEPAHAARQAWYDGTAAACPQQLLTDIRLSIDQRP